MKKFIFYKILPKINLDKQNKKTLKIYLFFSLQT